MATLTLSFTVPDDKADGIKEDLIMAFGYDETVTVPKKQFLKHAVKELLLRRLREYRQEEARKNATIDFDNSYIN